MHGWLLEIFQNYILEEIINNEKIKYTIKKTKKGMWSFNSSNENKN